MAIRKPSIYRLKEWVVQDFFFFEEDSEELRYLLIKYDGEEFDLVQQTFDTNSPDLKGGPIVARIDYTVIGQTVTIDSWENNWRDEWPLRIAVQFLVNCLYTPGKNFVIRVNKDAYPFWVSERFFPYTNNPNDFLLQEY